LDSTQESKANQNIEFILCIQTLNVTVS
jgi:hypothetical protein